MLFKGEEKLDDSERVVLLTIAWLMIFGANPKKETVRISSLQVYSARNDGDLQRVLKRLERKKLVRVREDIFTHDHWISFKGEAKKLELTVETGFEVRKRYP